MTVKIKRIISAALLLLMLPLASCNHDLPAEGTTQIKETTQNDDAQAENKVIISDCKSDAPQYDTSGNFHTDFEGVELHAEKIELTADTSELKVYWVNNSKYAIVYGDPYYIEREQNGEWILCCDSSDLVFTCIGYHLNPGEFREKVYGLNNPFDISIPGKYRIRTDCSVYEKGRGGSATECVLWAEFTVKAHD